MNFSNTSPSHGLPFFTNCSSVGPFYGVQSFRNRLLQCGSCVGSQVLPANLVHRGLLSPLVHRSCQEPVPARAPHRVTASFGYPPALAWGPPRAAEGYLLHRGPPWAAGAQPASPWSSPQAAGEPLLWCLEHLLPLHLHLTLVSAELFLTHILSPLLCYRFFSPSEICYHRHATSIADGLGLDHWWVCLGASWNWRYRT